MYCIWISLYLFDESVAVEQGAPHYTLYVEKSTQQATMTHHPTFNSPIRLVIFLGIEAKCARGPPEIRKL